MKTRMNMSLKLGVLFALVTSLAISVSGTETSTDISRKVVPQVLQRSPEELRPWRAPVYKDQSKALGYVDNVFAVPKGMEKQVQFWVDIYSKYSTQEAVLHDAETFEILEVVNLQGLRTEREKQKKVDSVKKVLGHRIPTQAARERIRFQLGQKDRMQEAIFYSGRYLEDMETIFREAQLPIELTRLAFVESSFNIMARSKVGASGIWQIMPYSARPYKMISPTVDKRNHPLEATRFAARMLRNNYNMLQSWPLAVTGYNHGPTGVLKMTKKYESRELPELIQNVRSRKSFGFASRNFYASFLAALEVEKNAAFYFGPSVAWSRKLDGQDLKLPVRISYSQLLSWFDGNDRKAQMFNPHLTSKARKGKMSIPAHTVVAVPKDKYNIALISLARRDRDVAMDKRGAADRP